MSLLNRWVLIGPGSERRTGYIAEHAHPPSCHGNRSHCEDKAVCHQECCIDSLLASVAIHLPFCCFVLGANIGRHVLTITTSIQSIKMEGKCFICNVFFFFPLSSTARTPCSAYASTTLLRNVAGTTCTFTTETPCTLLSLLFSGEAPPPPPSQLCCFSQQTCSSDVTLSHSPKLYSSSERRKYVLLLPIVSMQVKKMCFSLLHF